MLSKNQTLRTKEKIITWLIAIVVALALLVSFVVVESQLNNSAKVGVSSKMSLDVQYWLFREGYTTPVITIKNLQNIMRTDCAMAVNDKYIFTIQEIPSADVSQDIITINANYFVKEDGTVFNPISDSIQSACITCKGPVYNSYCGNFTR